MPPIDAPEAPVIDPEVPAVPDPESPTEDADDAAAAAQTTQTPVPSDAPKLKEVLDKYSQQGRKLAQAERLAQQHASQIAQLIDNANRVNATLSQQQVAAFKANLATMSTEEQVAFLLERQLNPPAPTAPAPRATPELTEVQQRVAAHLEDVNNEFGLDGEASITGNEPELDASLHRDEGSFLAAAWKLARKKAGDAAVPKPENKTLTVEEQVTQRVAAETAKIRAELGIGRPNAATATGSPRGGAGITDLNAIAARTDIGPAEKARLIAAVKVA